MPPETITARAPTGPTGAFTAAVATCLGRASHALEDFFAHSNFVELAIGEPTPVIVLTGRGLGETGTSSEQLGTGSFGAIDKMHALSHKIRGIADEIDAEIPLVEHLTGRSRERPQPSSVEIGSAESPHGTEEGRESTSGWDVLGQLASGVLSKGVEGSGQGMSLVGPAGAFPGFLIGAGRGLHGATESTVRDVVATREGAQMLHRAAEAIEDFTRAHEKAGSHTAIAKDQPGHAEEGEEEARSKLKTIKFDLAYQLAAEADRMVVGSMRTVFDVASPESADLALQDIYTTLNSLLAPPDGHPLEPVIAPRREEARTELEELRRQQRERGAAH